jgi:hypothetical protein
VKRDRETFYCGVLLLKLMIEGGFLVLGIGAHPATLPKKPCSGSLGQITPYKQSRQRRPKTNQKDKRDRQKAPTTHKEQSDSGATALLLK